MTGIVGIHSQTLRSTVLAICSADADRYHRSRFRPETTAEVEMAPDSKISLAVLAGDGIRPEITQAAGRVLEGARPRPGLDIPLTRHAIRWQAYETTRST